MGKYSVKRELNCLFLAGVLLGVSYVYTKNLWFPVALHFSWNFFEALFGFNVSGQDFYSLIDFNITEKNLLNGKKLINLINHNISHRFNIRSKKSHILTCFIHNNHQ